MHIGRLTALGAIAAMAFASADALAAYRFVGITNTRWGINSETLGIPMSSHIESFEDVNLEPGLQISWQSGGGDTAPTSVLPRLYDCSVGDAAGSAFVNGQWDGTHALVSGRGNASYGYGTGYTNWGKVTLHFNPPVHAVGFSLQQADIDVRLIINGVDRGSVGGTGLPTNGGRSGYVLVQATGTDTISTLQLSNQNTGDGWVIDRLAYTTEPIPEVLASGFATGGKLTDDQLGLSGAVIEDFEDVNLVPGLKVLMESPLGTWGPAPTLPAVFVAATGDPFGTAFVQGAWDGTHCLLSTRDNASHGYFDLGNWGDIALVLDTPAYVVGFSVTNLESPSRLIVNGHDVGSFESLTGLPFAAGRNGFARIGTTGPATIKSLRWANTRRASGNDGIAIDHVAIINCAVDYNNDGFITFEDFDAYVVAFEAGQLRADLNNDGFLTFEDFDGFIAIFEAGGC